MRIPSKAMIVAAAALVAGCAAEPFELSGHCGLNDPASEWVVGNKLARLAEQRCEGPYRVLERKDIALTSGHEFRWLVDCQPDSSR